MNTYVFVSSKKNLTSLFVFLFFVFFLVSFFSTCVGSASRKILAVIMCLLSVLFFFFFTFKFALSLIFVHLEMRFLKLFLLIQ